MKSKWPFLVALIVCFGFSSSTVVNEGESADESLAGSVVPESITSLPPTSDFVTSPTQDVHRAAANVQNPEKNPSSASEHNTISDVHEGTPLRPSSGEQLEDGVSRTPSEPQNIVELPTASDIKRPLPDGGAQDVPVAKVEGSAAESAPSQVQPTTPTPSEKSEVFLDVPSSQPSLSIEADTATSGDAIVSPNDANAAGNEPVAPVISPAGEIDTFSDWTKKKLEAVAKERESSAAAGSSSTSGRVVSSVGVQDGKSAPSPGSGRVKVKKRNRKNFASSDCGAKVLASNPEAQSASAILSSGMDEYFLSPCKVKNFIYFVIELCEAIEPSRFELGVFELYSSLPKDFVVGISDRFPTRDWVQLGRFEARDVRGTQNFTVAQSPRVFGKYIKVEILSHFGSEHFCPISMFKVYGTSELEAMEQINVESHVNLENGNGAPLYALDEDEYIDDSDDDGEPDVPKPKNLFGSAKDAVMSIVKKAAEAFSAGGPKDGLKDLSSEAPSQDIDDGKQGSLAGWKGACACPSKRVPSGVSGEAWDAYSCARQWDSQTLADVRPKNWQPCFDSLRHDVVDLQANPGVGSGCTCSPISRLFAAFLTKDQILALAVTEAIKAADLNRSSGGNVTCDGEEGSVSTNVTIVNETTVVDESGTAPFSAEPVLDGKKEKAQGQSEKPQMELDSIRPSPSSKAVDTSADGTVDSPVLPVPTSAVDSSSSMHALATDLVEDDGSSRPSQPAVTPSSTFLPTAASFPDPGEGLPSSSHPTDTGFVIVEPPSSATSKPTGVAPSPVTPNGEVEELKQPAVTSPVPPPAPAPSSDSVPTTVPGNEAISNPDGSSDLTGRIEIGPNVPYVQLPASSQPPGNKETVFWRLSNKVKALELNLTLSSLYLEELSRSYKRQVEDLTKSVNKYQQQMNNYTTLIQELVSKVASLNGSLDETSKKLEVYEAAQPVPFWLFLASQTFLMFAISMLWMYRPQEAQRPLPVVRTDPTVAPAVLRPARSRQNVAEPSLNNANKAQYAWLDQKRVVCGRAVPVGTLVAGYQNGGVGHSPTRTLQVVSAGVVGRSRAPSSSDQEGGLGPTRLRLISGSEGLDLSPRRTSSVASPALTNGSLKQLQSSLSSQGMAAAPTAANYSAISNVGKFQERTNIRTSSRSPARPSLQISEEPPSEVVKKMSAPNPLSASSSPSKLVRRHSFTCKEESEQKWSLAGSKSRLKTSSFAPPNQPHVAAKKRKRKNKSSVDLQASCSSGSVRSAIGDSRDSILEAVESTNRWFVLDTQDVRI